MAEDLSPDLTKILQRLDAVEHRLARLETARPERAAAPMLQPSFKPVPRQPPPSPAPHIDESEPSPTKPEEILTVLPVHPPTPPVPAESAFVLPEHPARKPWSPRTEQVPPPFSKSDFEQMIGLKWAGWIGAIVLVIGVGLGIKFGYDQGWFGHMPVRLRLFLMSLGGFALLAAGEIVYRRINQISAAGLFGAGVAVLFVISYAGNVYYAAYDYHTAFVFALATTVIGSAVAMRGRLVSIAVLAQIGGHIAPMVLSTGQPPGVALLAYVLTLQIVALVLAMWGRTPKWWILRAVSLAPTGWWVVVCLLQGHWGAGLANEVLWFTVVYAAAYQGELLRSALLAGEQQDQSQPPTAGFGSIFSLLVTA